jgi:hypothetical protein
MSMNYEILNESSILIYILFIPIKIIIVRFETIVLYTVYVPCLFHKYAS